MALNTSFLPPSLCLSLSLSVPLLPHATRVYVLYDVSLRREYVIGTRNCVILRAFLGFVNDLHTPVDSARGCEIKRRQVCVINFRSDLSNIVVI